MNNNNLESGGGVEGHARIRRDGTGRINPAVGLLDGAKVTSCAQNVIPLIAPTQAGTATGPLDSFISFNQRYVLRLMVWTFLLGFAWATITWLARVTQGQNVIAKGTNNLLLITNLSYFVVNTSNTYSTITSNGHYRIGDSHAHIDSNFEPVVVRTNGRWRITFKP